MHGIALIIFIVYVAWAISEGIKEEGEETRRMLDYQHRRDRGEF